MAGAEGRVAGAEDDEIAVEDTGGVDFPARHDVGSPGQEIDGQESEGGGGGGELNVGSGGEEAAFVQAIERLTVEGGYTDAEGGVA